MLRTKRKRLIAYVIKDEYGQWLGPDYDWRSDRRKAKRFLPNPIGLAQARKWAKGTAGRVFRIVRRRKAKKAAA